MKKLILVILCLGLFSGCSVYQRVQGTYIDVVGVWKYKAEEIAVPVTLHINDDYTYYIDTDGDKEKNIWGTYKIFRNQITFRDDRASQSADICFEPGIFYYDVYRQDITFEEIADQCKFRVMALSYQWTKVRKNKKSED